MILVTLLIATTASASAVTIPTGKLKIQAIPSMPKVGEEVRFIVTTELTNEPVADAEIWIAKVGAEETVEAVIQALTEGKVGELVGYTDQNGEFRYSFDDWGVYVVQAKKEGFIRSITTVEVKPLGTLKIITKKETNWIFYVDEPTFYKVMEMWSQGASEEEIRSYIEEHMTHKDEIYVSVKVIASEWGGGVSGAKVYVNGQFVGETDQYGYLGVYLKSGVYLITAEKKGYIPGANVTVTITKEDIENRVKELIEKAKEKVEEKKEEIEEFLKLLKVDNPKVVKVGEEFEIKVTFKGEPVSDATITITKRGIVVQTGKTDANGIFRASLDEEGVYIITATKEGYRSGKSVVAVVPTVEIKPLTFVHIMPVIEPEKPGIVEVCKAFVKELKIKVKKKIEDVIVEVKQLKELPKEIAKPPGLVYVCMEIEVTAEPGTVEEGEITFNVSKEWLAENNIDKTTVVLMKYVDGQWIPLDTRIIGEDDQYVYYVAKTPAFSIYAITAETGKATTTPVEEKTPTEVKTPTETPVKEEKTPTEVETPTKEEKPVVEEKPAEKETPGFEVIAGLIAGVTALVLRRRF